MEQLDIVRKTTRSRTHYKDSDAIVEDALARARENASELVPDSAKSKNEDRFVLVLSIVSSAFMYGAILWVLAAKLQVPTQF